MWWWLPSALAWMPVDAQTISLPARPVAMAWVRLDQPTLLVLDGERLMALEGQDIVASRKADATDLIASDLDGDGRTDLLLCGPSGLSALPLAPRSFGDPIQLDATPCDVMASRAQEVVFTGPEGTRVVTLSDGGLVVDELPLVVEGEPLLAVTADAILLGTVGSETIARHDGEGLVMVPTGGTLLDLTARDDIVAWLREADGRTMLSVRGEELGVDAMARHLAWRPASDGPDLVLWGDVWLDADWNLPVGPPLFVDVEGDGCAEVYVAVDGGFVHAKGRCNEPEPAMQPPPPAPIAGEPGAAPTAENPSVKPDDVAYEDTTWPPRAWTRGKRVRPRDLPAPPEALSLSVDERATVRAFVGQRIDMVLTPPSGRILKVEGGPPGSHLEDGRFVLEPEGWDIGRWGVAVRAGAGEWYGFDLEIWPRPRPGDPVPEKTSSVNPPTPSVATMDAGDRWYHIDRCSLGVGVAAGASRSGGLVWEDLGSPSVQPSASPAVAAVCTGGGLLSWTLGLDAAPWFRYTDVPADRSHLIGATAGLQLATERFGIGPYGSAGVTAVNVGLRGQGFATDRYGLELRAGWLAPRAGVEAMALFLVRLGPGAI